jgi:hypothetical protein
MKMTNGIVSALATGGCGMPLVTKWAGKRCRTQNSVRPWRGVCAHLRIPRNGRLEAYHQALLSGCATVLAHWKHHLRGTRSSRPENAAEAQAPSSDVPGNCRECEFRHPDLGGTATRSWNHPVKVRRVACRAACGVADPELSRRELVEP